MDHSRRPRPLSPSPPMQANICPICSISHFPFCPPNHQFNQSPRFQFQSHNDQFFRRPPFDHYFDHRGPSVNPHLTFVDGFGDPSLPWHRNHSLDRDPCGHSNSSYDYGSAGFKRMRVDELGSDSGSFMGENYVNSSRVSAEDERRLKLIRDHGSVLSGPLEGGFIKGYAEEGSGFDRGFRSFDHDEYKKIDESRGGRNDYGSKSISNFEINYFRDPDFGNFDRNVTSFHLEPGFNQQEHSSTFGQNYMKRNRYEERGESRYDQVKNHFKDSGHSGLPAGNFTTDEHAGLSQGVAALYCSNLGDGYLPVAQKVDINPLSHASQSVTYPNFEAHSENYNKYSLQQIHPGEPASAKESHYSHPTKSQGTSGLSAPYQEQKNNFSMENHNLNNHLSVSYAMHHNMGPKYDRRSRDEASDMMQPFGASFPYQDGTQGPVGHKNFLLPSQSGPPNLKKHGGYLLAPIGTDIDTFRAPSGYKVQPPLPPSPPPPLPVEPPGRPLPEPPTSSSPPRTSSSLFPIPVSSSGTLLSSYPQVPDAPSMLQAHYPNKSTLHASTRFVNEEFQATRQESSKKFLGESQHFPLKHLSSDKPKVVDASHIFKHPHRATRPDHIVIILRGLPGSGKSYLAKMLRVLEVENGGNAPRIHSMDDYFMTEVEKVDETEASRSSASVRGKRPVTKKVMEYCYEPEMEEAYRSSMLKTFKKTLDEGVFSFVLVDDRNLRVADFAQFWATAKRSGYEVYLLEAAYKDPAGCAARNVHGFTQDDIQKMVKQWEEAPSLYLKLDIESLLHGDDLEENGIQEVDMDTEDGEPAGRSSGLEERDPEVIERSIAHVVTGDPSKNAKRYDAEEDHPREEVKELRRSKWSNDLDEDYFQGTETTKGSSSALSGLIQAYGKDGRSVRWGDQVGHTGFSIGAAKKANVLSLVIGPGAGYNLKSNPLPEEQNLTSTRNTGELKRQNIFQEQIRAERESFRAVFDRRRQRIGGLDVDEE